MAGGHQTARVQVHTVAWPKPQKQARCGSREPESPPECTVGRGANGGCHYEGLRASGGAVLDEAMTGVSCGEEAHRGGRREAAAASSFPVAGGCRARGRKARGRRGSGPGQGGGQGRPWQDGPQGPQERSLTSQATASPREMAGKASCRQ